MKPQNAIKNFTLFLAEYGYLVLLLIIILFILHEVSTDIIFEDQALRILHNQEHWSQYLKRVHEHLIETDNASMKILLRLNSTLNTTS